MVFLYNNDDEDVTIIFDNEYKIYEVALTLTSNVTENREPIFVCCTRRLHQAIEENEKRRVV